MSEFEYAEIISKNLRRIMYEHDKTQADVSKDLKISKATLSSWMNGTRVPRMDKVDLLCHYFNIKRRDLMEAPEDNDTTQDFKELKMRELLSTLSDAEWEELENYIDFMKSKRRPS